MRVLAIGALSAFISGCAFPQQVNRFGVEYNTALANMDNEQTLLNILRARDGMPTHFSSVSQFRGAIALTAAASMNAQLKGSGITTASGSSSSNTTASSRSITTSTTTPGALPTTSTVESTAATPMTGTSVMQTVAEGVDIFTPQVSGQIVSGTNFDVDVYDTQKFFQGITGAIPFSTIETFLAEGIDNRVLALLTMARVDFRIDEAFAGIPKGTTIRSLINDPNDTARSREFADFVACYELGSGIIAKSSTKLVAISRITRGPDGKAVPLPLDKVILIDGERFEFSQEGVPGHSDTDDDIYLNRVNAERRVARLSQRAATCKGANDQIVNLVLPNGKAVTVAVPNAPPTKPLYLGEGYALLLAEGKLQMVPVTMEITFRSPEGIFRYLGAYLSNDLGRVIRVDDSPLFSLEEGRASDALAQATYRHRTFSLVNLPGTHGRNASIFTLLQQLINLQKEASERPSTIPVRAIP